MSNSNENLTMMLKIAKEMTRYQELETTHTRTLLKWSLLTLAVVLVFGWCWHNYLVNTYLPNTIENALYKHFLKHFSMLKAPKNANTKKIIQKKHSPKSKKWANYINKELDQYE